MAIVEHPHPFENGRETQWPELSRRIAKTAKRRNISLLWPELAEAKHLELSSVLCWGLEVNGELTDSTLLAARLACGMQQSPRLGLSQATSLSCQVELFLDRLAAGPLDIGVLSEAVAWAYAMPNLAINHVVQFAQASPLEGSVKDKKASRSRRKETTNLPTGKEALATEIDENLWWALLGELQTISRSAIEQLGGDSPERLLAAGEIGTILAWQLSALPSCDAIRDDSLDAICQWFDGEGDSVASALVDGGRKLRTVLAAALRTRRLANRMKRRIVLKRSGAAVDIATWIAATCRSDGSQALGPREAGKSDLRQGSLMALAASELGGPALQTALDATLGKTKSEGKLAWQVELPEPAWFDDEAGLVVMLPEWDVRRGRVAISYKHPDRKIRFEITGGKHVLASGTWGARLWHGDVELRPKSDWQDLCWHSDDDVHYLELEQLFEGDVKVQRQILMLRDDRCLMLADAVLGGDKEDLKFVAELPLASTVHVEEERETRELLLVDGKVRALLMPLGMSEWKVGKTAGHMIISDHSDAERNSAHLSILAEVKGQGAVYSPLWFDFDRKRVRRQRTWRHLTIGEKLRLVDPHEAAAFRVQSGDDQWVIYRSLNGQHNRTFLGKNLISEFFCGRFDADDGTLEELVSVDEQNR